tara:strand:- start:2810 stop:3766 length:957 start_codon:yes stop_codon:yes gene_type:complete
MGFLDNSGDIILDAVLTDHGRKVLSRGDGTFRIVKFALGDEEIDYSLYDSSNANGSAYYDLEILQTPILEAFTDNAISMKSKLVTYDDLGLLYLPVIKLNESSNSTKMHSSGSFIVAVDRITEDDNSLDATQVGIGFTNGNLVNGILFGASLSDGGMIRLDQGLDTTALSYATRLPEDMFESGYTIQIDNRFGSIADKNGSAISFDYVDDDDIAFYTITDVQSTMFSLNSNTTDAASSSGSGQVIAGPRGTILEFKIRASLDLNTSNYLFTELGSTSRLDNRGNGSSEVYHIDSIVRVTGITTGYTVDLPVRFVKYKS